MDNERYIIVGADCGRTKFGKFICVCGKCQCLSANNSDNSGDDSCDSSDGGNDGVNQKTVALCALA